MLSASIALILGILTAVTAAWMFRGRSERARAWTRNSQGFIDDRFVFLLLPGLSIIFCSFGAMGLSYQWLSAEALMVAWALCAFFAVLGIIAAIWSLLPVRVPRAFTPQWRRVQLARDHGDDPNARGRARRS